MTVAGVDETRGVLRQRVEASTTPGDAHDDSRDEQSNDDTDGDDRALRQASERARQPW